MKNYFLVGIRQALIFLVTLISLSCFNTSVQTSEVRERISFNDDWKFFKYENSRDADSLIYDVRPEVRGYNDDIAADTKPTKSDSLTVTKDVLKPWILPSGNKFLRKRDEYVRPHEEPFPDFPFIQSNYDDTQWKSVDLPHDWAIQGPFMEGGNTNVGGGMGRLPSPGVGWYRKKFNLSNDDLDKEIFLEIDGAMSYAMVWLNGKIVGGWPYGYNSWQLNLSPYIQKGENQIAIRLDNPPASSRWYPGGGIYRNVWLLKKNPIHVDQWGTFITGKDISSESATISLDLSIKNSTEMATEVLVKNEIYELDDKRGKVRVAEFGEVKINIDPLSIKEMNLNKLLKKPKLWEPTFEQNPNLYAVVTKIYKDKELVDQYITKFGLRSLDYDPTTGLLVNGKKIPINGVNLHHDLGALGAAFNKEAAKRQLKLLREMGVNAVRMAHNPPAPELLDLTDEMGFLVVDEIFDVWERKKTPLDFHLIFKDWHEQDLRAFIRRDRNHPSIILWSYGNEVGEQYDGQKGAELSTKLKKIIQEEDTTRPTTVSMNYAKPDMAFSKIPDVINLNYQGEGIRDTPAHIHLKGIHTPPLYDAFHKKFPEKVIISSENAATLSTRDEFILPVQPGISYPVADSLGGNSKKGYVSDYGIYAVEFGSSPDKVFKAKDQHPFVAGGFVWSGWDYLGEPSPYYSARSSYFGIIDLAGFKKSRFYQYQARWRPNHKMAHIIPHWNWPKKTGKIVPVHVFTSGDEAELFLDGRSLGRKKKGKYEYRFRWDSVQYRPGKLKVITYKQGEKWAIDSVSTTGEAKGVRLKTNKKTLRADGKDLVFVTAEVVDENGLVVPTEKENLLELELIGPGSIVATDNGNPMDFTPFGSTKRKVFNGKALAIIKANEREHNDQERKLLLKVNADILKTTQSITIEITDEDHGSFE